MSVLHETRSKNQTGHVVVDQKSVENGSVFPFEHVEHQEGAVDTALGSGMQGP